MGARAPENYFMLNGLERDDCAASIFRVDVILSLKMEADHLQFFSRISGCPWTTCLGNLGRKASLKPFLLLTHLTENNETNADLDSGFHLMKVLKIG